VSAIGRGADAGVVADVICGWLSRRAAIRPGDMLQCVSVSWNEPYAAAGHALRAALLVRVGRGALGDPIAILNEMKIQQEVLGQLQKELLNAIPRGEGHRWWPFGRRG
jgi:hypothetical protein